MVEDGDVQVISLLIAQVETWSKLRNSPPNTDEVPFRTSLADSLVWNMPANITSYVESS